MFMNEVKIDLPGVGRKESKIAIIGDICDGFDMNARKPFSGPAGTVLENCLHNAGLIRGECYLTNVIKIKTSSPHTFYSRNTKGEIKFTEKGMEYVKLLQAELSEVGANIFVAAGEVSFASLCSLAHHSSYRGYVFPSTLLPGKKVIPIYPPRSAIRGMYTHRYLIATDLRKIREESFYPDIHRPDRKLIYTYDSINDALEWLKYYEEEKIVGFDIEVINYEISCISFSSSPELACVIPISERWALDEEVYLWRGIQKVLGNPKSKKVVQNGMFDIPFLLTRNGCVVRGEIHDTMIGHSIMYPELPKSLGFLGSIYCGAQEYWKDTVKFKSIKEED